MTINALAAAGDVLIAAILCTMLQKSRTGFKRYVFLLPDFFPATCIIRSDTMINKLVILHLSVSCQYFLNRLS